MLLYLCSSVAGQWRISTDTVAKIGDESVSVQDVRQRSTRSSSAIPI